jgi:hypothetical protein
MKRILSALGLLFVFAAQLSAEEIAVDLRFEPTVAAVPAEKLLAEVKQFRGVRILPFSDKRSAGETFLGELRQNGQVRTVKSKKAVAGYATDAFTQVYGEWGGRISPDGPLSLTGEITQFEFEENDSYQARIGVHFYLVDDSRRVLWDGHSSGAVRGTGKVIGAENLSVLFSNVLSATFIELLEDQKLVGVWSGRVSNTYLLTEDATTAKAAR